MILVKNRNYPNQTLFRWIITDIAVSGIVAAGLAWLGLFNYNEVQKATHTAAVARQNAAQLAEQAATAHQLCVTVNGIKSNIRTFIDASIPANPNPGQVAAIAALEGRESVLFPNTRCPP